ncbi:MAG: ribosomal RNA small subunit methyltransferase A [Proteobacteria bacterium]|nr:ribosomal RNA small subunit methyltransferase A [Pseudomonadota bacterium]
MKTDKRLGQHWLRDGRVIERIAEAIGPHKDGRVVEIGPGTGALTRALLEQGAIVYALELDSRCWPVLDELAEEFKGQLEVLRGDALEADWDGLLCGGQVPVAGNLPYNVGTEIVARLVTLPKPPREMVFMLQKEVVLRICARPDTRDWGRLGVLCDLLCERKKLFDVAPGAFAPPPKVMSAVVRLTPLPAPRYKVDMGKLDRLLRLVFGQRRKMLRGVLKGLVSEEQMQGLGIDPAWRGEVLDTQKLCALAGLI